MAATTLKFEDQLDGVKLLIPSQTMITQPIDNNPEIKFSSEI
jgi:hypothetical protein